MAGTDEKIEAITERKKTSWDRWQTLFDAAQDYLDDPSSDYLENRLMQKLMVISTHMQSQMSKLFEQADAKFILEHEVQKLKNAHQPKLTMVALYVTQIFGSIIGAGFGCAPSILSVTGNAAKSYQAISGGIQGVFGQGSQNMASLLQTKNQGVIAELQHALEAHKMQQNSHQQEFQRQQQIAQRHAEDKKHEEQKRHETTKAITGN